MNGEKPTELQEKKETNELDSLEEKNDLVLKQEEEESSEDSVEESKVLEVKEQVKEEEKKDERDPFAHLSLPPMGSDDEFESESESEEQTIDINRKSKEKPKENKPFSIADLFDDEDDGLTFDNAKPLPNVQMGSSNSRVSQLLNDDLFGSSSPSNNDFGITDQFNDPSITQLDSPTQVGGGYGGGRSVSPKLFASVSQFPSCHQLRVWKWENGIPLGLGVIDAMATEEDFVEEFYDAMPKRGEKKCQFKIRPIDINGNEMGQEKTLFISEHHAAVTKIRKMKKAQREEKQMSSLPPEFTDYDEGPTVATEMTRMFENIVSQSDRRAQALEQSLIQERERMRELDAERAEERVQLAQNAAQGVQVLTERMLHDESSRSERALKMQNEQSQLLLTTLTSVFSQQQSMMAQNAELQRKADEYRIEQERVRAERERSEIESRRQQDRLEYEERLRREQQQLEARFKEMEETKRWEREKLQEEKRREKEDYDRRKDQERLDYERKLKEEQLRVDRERQYNEQRGQREREDFLARIERERNELLVKMQREQQEWDRRLERERLEKDRKELERKEEMLLRQKQLELQAQKDREHAERMLQMAMLEREQQREASERRERMEREMRESQERERERRHQMMVKEMDQAREKDREHAERMISLSRSEKESSFLNDMVPKATGFLREMGIEPQEVIGRLLYPQPASGGGESKSGWLDNLPKVLGVASELLKSGMANQGMMPPPRPPMLPQGQTLPQDFQQQQMMYEELQRRQQPIPTPTNTTIPQPMSQQTSNVTPNDSVVENVNDDEISLMQMALDADINMKDQRNARKGLRNLVRQLQVSEKEQWTDLITQAIINEVAIFTYISAVSLEQALLEAGAESNFITDVSTELKKSELVPNDLPYTLNDLNKG